MKTRAIICCMFIPGLIGLQYLNAQGLSTPEGFIELSPLVGIGISKNLNVHGKEFSHEYRISYKLGFTGSITFSYGNTDLPSTTHSIQTTTERLYDHVLSAGIKYYIGTFYLSCKMGYGKNGETLSYTDNVLPTETTKKDLFGIESNSRYGPGYLIPFNKKNNAELFLRKYGTNNQNISTGFNLIFGG